MTEAIFPTPEQWAQLLEIGVVGAESGLVIVSPDVMHVLKDRGLTKEAIAERLSYYDFGGEADLWVDVVASIEHDALRLSEIINGDDNGEVEG